MFHVLHQTGSYSLKEHETVFRKRQNLIILLWPEVFDFLSFRLNFFRNDGDGDGDAFIVYRINVS